MIIDVDGVDRDHVAELAKTPMGFSQILTAAIVTSMSYQVAHGDIKPDEWADGDRALVIYRQCRKVFMDGGWPDRFSELKLVVDRIVNDHARTILARRGY